MTLPSRSARPPRLRRRARGPRRRRLHHLDTPDRPAARRPGRPRRGPDRLRGGARGRPARAGRGRRRPADRALRPRAGRHPRRALRLPRGRRRHARPAGRPVARPRTDFRRTVLETLHAEVLPGDVLTYGELAARIGHPKAARAVGSACATNPVPLIVPCHRVVPGSGGSAATAAARRASASCSPTRARPSAASWAPNVGESGVYPAKNDVRRSVARTSTAALRSRLGRSRSCGAGKCRYALRRRPTCRTWGGSGRYAPVIRPA